jgi:protein CpxP
MNPFYTLLTVLLITGVPALAQQGRDTIRPASTTRPQESKRKKMVEELGLTKKQAGELKEINKEFAPKIKALRADSTMDKKQKRQQVMQLMKDRDDKIKGVLSPEQQAKYQEMEKQQLQNRRNNKEDDSTP